MAQWFADSDATLVRGIRLEDRAVDTLLDKIDDIADPTFTDRRADPRFRYRLRNCVVHVQQPGDAHSQAHLVTTRDLSAGGVSFLRSGFVHIGSRCIVQLVSLKGEWSQVRGVVQNCRYVGEGLYVIGVSFGSAVEIAMYVSTKAPTRILLLEPDIDQAKLFAFHLRPCKVVVDHALDVETAIAKSREKIADLLAMRAATSEGDLLNGVSRLRSSGYLGVVAALHAELPSPADLATLGAGCDLDLLMPIDKASAAALVEAIDIPLLRSDMHHDVEAIGDLTAYISGLADRQRSLCAAANDRDANALSRVLRETAHEAREHGYLPIGVAATELAAKVAEPLDVAVIVPPLRALIGLFTQARRMHHRIAATQPPKPAEVAPTIP